MPLVAEDLKEMASPGRIFWFGYQFSALHNFKDFVQEFFWKIPRIPLTKVARSLQTCRVLSEDKNLFDGHVPTRGSPTYGAYGEVASYWALSLFLP